MTLPTGNQGQSVEPAKRVMDYGEIKRSMVQDLVEQGVAQKEAEAEVNRQFEKKASKEG